MLLYHAPRQTVLKQTSVKLDWNLKIYNCLVFGGVQLDVS